MLLIYFALPTIGLEVPRFAAGVATLTLGTMAYNCEIWRATLLAFPSDQLDAARAFGMPARLRFRLVILPQIARAALPALVNEMTLIIKVSPAVAVIGVIETTRAAVRIGAATYDTIPPFLVALGIYVVIIAAFVADPADAGAPSPGRTFRMIPAASRCCGNNGSAMLSGLLTTIGITLVAAMCAGLLGLLLFALLISRVRAVEMALSWLIDLMRCVPFMLFCYMIYYGLPSFGIVIGNLSAGIIALTLYNAAYIAELLRGGYQALPRDGIEAGHAFGFHGCRLLLRIILPPVLLSSIPMFGNQMVQIIKDSAFLVIIAVQELTFAANEIQATYYVPFASFVCAMLLYWVLCLAVEAGVRAVLTHGRSAAMKRRTKWQER